MSAVDYTFYTGVYMGEAATEAAFPALDARAEDIIAALTRYRVTDLTSLPEAIQTLYKKAVCAQIDFFALNGLDIAADASAGAGWSVGKVRVDGRRSSSVGAGAMAGMVSPAAKMYLEQTGLMSAKIAVAPDMPMIGWW